MCAAADGCEDFKVGRDAFESDEGAKVGIVGGPCAGDLAGFGIKEGVVDAREFACVDFTGLYQVIVAKDVAEDDWGLCPRGSWRE